MRVNLTSYVHKIKILIARLDKLNEFNILYIRLKELNADLWEIVTAGRLILHDFVQTIYY